MPAMNLDIWDQAALTAQVVRKLKSKKESLPSLADSIAPMQEVRERRLKMRVLEVDAFGIGQLRAPDGDPKLFRTNTQVREELIELALPDEMERLSEDILDRLDSTDPLIKLSAGADAVTRGMVLAERSLRRVEQMRWSAFLNGYVDLAYDNNEARRVTYGIPAGNKVTAGTLWSTLSADVISQVRGWQKTVADQVGEYGLWLHMNSNTYEYLYNNTVIAAKLSSWGRSTMQVSGPDEIASLFREGSQIKIYDGGYRDVVTPRVDITDNTSFGDSKLTKWLPDGKVLITPANYAVDGQPIADTPNGRVRVATGYNTAVWKQGPATETILHPISKNEFLRHARANIPRLQVPEAFFIATVL